MSGGALTRVLIAHGSDEMYGSDRIILGIATAMQSAGMQVTVLLPDDTAGPLPLSTALSSLGIPVEHMPLAVLRRRYASTGRVPRLAGIWGAATARLARLIRRWKPDVVYSNTLAVTAAAAAARLVRVPHLWHVHEIISSPQWLGCSLARLAGTLSTRVIAVSQAVDTWLRAQAPRICSVVVPNGVPDPMQGIDRRLALEVATATLGLPPDAPLVLMVARLSGWKGARVFAELARCHVRAGGRAHFAIVGGPVPGERAVLDSVLHIARDPVTRGALHWVDFTKDVPSLLARASVFVLPSIRPDPFPTSAIEAMYAALPVVAFNHGGVLEMIEPTNAGIAVPVGDSSAMLHTVEALLADPERARRMGERGRAHALQAFDPMAFHRRVLAELEAIVGATA